MVNKQTDRRLSYWKKRTAKFDRIACEARIGLGKIQMILDTRGDEITGLARDEMTEVLGRLLPPTPGQYAEAAKAKRLVSMAQGSAGLEGQGVKPDVIDRAIDTISGEFQAIYHEG